VRLELEAIDVEPPGNFGNRTQLGLVASRTTPQAPVEPPAGAPSGREVRGQLLDNERPYSGAYRESA
jgi:hypothetical protein